MNPDTMPNSGFCGSIPKSNMTAQEIGRVPLKAGADTIVVHICDDVAHCTTNTYFHLHTELADHRDARRHVAARVQCPGRHGQFSVHRLDADTTTGSYTLATCGHSGPGVPSCTSRRLDQTPIGGQTNKTVNVTFTGGASISSGRVTLTATLAANPAMTDAASDSVISSIPGIAIAPKNTALNAAVAAAQHGVLYGHEHWPDSSHLHFHRSLRECGHGVHPIRGVATHGRRRLDSPDGELQGGSAREHGHGHTRGRTHYDPNGQGLGLLPHDSHHPVVHDGRGRGPRIDDRALALPHRRGGPRRGERVRRSPPRARAPVHSHNKQESHADAHLQFGFRASGAARPAHHHAAHRDAGAG